MEVKAKLSFLRMAPRKVRLITDLISGMEVVEAQNQLQFISKRAGLPLLKLLNSAVANAENNFKLVKDNLYIKKIFTNEGPTVYRFKPRAYGRAAPIRKRSTHITLILEEKKVSPKTFAKGGSAASGKIGKRSKKTKEELKIIKPEEVKKELPKKEFKEIKKERKPMSKMKEIKEKFTRRLGER